MSHGGRNSQLPSSKFVTNLVIDEIHTMQAGIPGDRRFSTWNAKVFTHWLQGKYKTFEGRPLGRTKIPADARV